ncbi:MAG: chloride channel protein [Gammaproteobacteria bacterium]|nr:chloride channel protein [Gammaproteobacteria bacterium]
MPSLNHSHNKDRNDSWFSQQLDVLRLHLSRPDALIQLAFLGLISGFLTGGIIILFRMIVEESQAGLLMGSAENYEALPLEARLLFPIAGSFAIALVFRNFANGVYVLGVARVMERMAYHQGYLTLRGFFLQFIGAALAIISGHSVGREGPNVFLGAASGSLLGQYLKLPNNSIRTLVGCGTAAGIAASFDTPLAGVIFALEVVMMEYTLASFMPVILAAGSATSISILVFGNKAAFVVPDLQQGALVELPLVIILGILAGTLSALFIHLLQCVAHKAGNLGFSSKVMISGVIVGLIGAMVPDVMGIGYDTVSQILAGDTTLTFLLLLLLFKLLATVASVGLGIPGGVIGPALFLGACLGGSFGILVRLLFPELQADTGFYSLLGMGAVMGASLQAPLAALTAMMELTHSPQIIMPGMIAIVIANLTASEIFRKKSLFVSVLEANDMSVHANPVTQALRRIGVGSVMNKAVVQTEPLLKLEKIDSLLLHNPEWLLVMDNDSQFHRLMPAIDLVRFIEQHREELHIDETVNEEEPIDLLEIPANRIEVASIHLQATLEEALNELDSHNLDALYVERMIAPGILHVYGVITRSQIESSYRL